MINEQLTFVFGIRLRTGIYQSAIRGIWRLRVRPIIRSDPNCIEGLTDVDSSIEMKIWI